MKLVLALVALLGLSAAAPQHKPRDLNDELQKFLDLIPFDDIFPIIEQHVENDGAVVAVVEYLQGDEWHNLVDTVMSKPQVIEFVQYLNDAGLPVGGIIDAIHDYIESLQPGTEPDQDGTLTELLDEIIPLIPIEDLLALLNDELQNSPEIQELYKQISSDEAHQLVDEVMEIEEVQRLIGRLNELGIPVDAILDIIYDFLGWSRNLRKVQPRDLNDELQKFLDLIPFDDILAIVEQHVENDGAVVAVVEYLQGDEWHNLVDTVLAKPQVVEFIQYLNDAGLPVSDIIDTIHNYIESLQPGTEPDQGGTLTELLDEIIPLIPIEDLLALLNDELQNSPEIQELYKQISSDEAHQLVDEVMEIEEVQRLIGRLNELGIPVDAILDIIYDFLGWSRNLRKVQPRDLNDELQKFLDLIPFDDILAIVEQHVENDGAVVAVVEYLQGDEWHNLVDTVLAKPQVVEFIQYLNDAGLPVSDIIDTIHNYIESLQPGTEPDQGGTLTELLDEIIPLIPIEDLLALLNDELQNSPEIQELYKQISSDEAHQLVDEVMEIEEVQRLIGRLNELGIPVDAILDIIYDFLGWSRN